MWYTIALLLVVGGAAGSAAVLSIFRATPGRLAGTAAAACVLTFVTEWVLIFTAIACSPENTPPFRAGSPLDRFCDAILDEPPSLLLFGMAVLPALALTTASVLGSRRRPHAARAWYALSLLAVVVPLVLAVSLPGSAV